MVLLMPTESIQRSPSSDPQAATARPEAPSMTVYQLVVHAYAAQQFTLLIPVL